MGMYTELHFNAALKQDIPDSVIKILKYMVGDGVDDTFLVAPSHPLFQNTRWSIMLRCDSYYFDADTHSTLRHDSIANQYFLCIRTNFKNYDDEINKFIDWITPYLDKFDGDFLGFHRYEETEIPKLIFMNGEANES